jgi:hypothetical protein
VLDVEVHLFETAFVQQDVQALTGGEPALGMMRVDAAPTAAQLSGCSAPLHFQDIR